MILVIYKYGGINMTLEIVAKLVKILQKFEITVKKEIDSRSDAEHLIMHNAKEIHRLYTGENLSGRFRNADDFYNQLKGEK